LNYVDELCKAMKMLADDPRTYFVGQAVAYEGTSMYHTLRDVPMEKRLELPVAEEMQMGMSIGMALTGMVPISIYPRFNFLLLATNQIVNHLDKLPIYSNGGYNPKVIIRTAVASESPLHPGAQHVGDFTQAFIKMCKTIKIVCLHNAEDIVKGYQQALTEPGSFLMVEWIDKYGKD
jgi:pyruvate/2-oxoglutarate/acetoin dehydrogenase E1 component